MQFDYYTQVVTQPTAEPISLQQAKDHLRVDVSADDDLIALYITAARRFCEHYCSSAFMPQTIRQDLDDLPDDVISLVVNPVQSVSNVKYYDTDGVLQTLSTSLYTVDTISNPARVIRKWDETWPVTESRGGAVQVTYVAGYAEGSPADDPQNVPADIKCAILLILGDLYENRENTLVGTVVSANAMELPMAAKMLLQPYRQYGL